MGIRSRPRWSTLGAALLLSASACASTPLTPEQETRNRELWRIALECQRLYPGIEQLEIRPDGFLTITYGDSLDESVRPFRACYYPKAGPLLYAEGTLVEDPAPPASDSISLEVKGTSSFVTAWVNGYPVTMLVDTGAALSSLNVAPAARAGLVRSRGSVRMAVRTAGGRVHDEPLVRAKTLKVGEYVVSDIDIGVHDGLAEGRGVDGILGTDFLRFFRVTLDPEGRRLTLERRARPAQEAAAARPAAERPPARLVQPTFWLDQGQAALLPPPGRIVPRPGGTSRTVVPVELTVGNSVVVPLWINGAAATLLLSHQAEKSWVTPEVAARAGLVAAADGPRVVLVEPDGERPAMPLARAERLEIGELVIEGMPLGLFDPGEYAAYDGDRRRLLTIDGQLGKDLLRLFYWHLDRAASALVLESLE